MNFTNDWFNYQRHFIDIYIPKPSEEYHILEIGAFEGRGTVYYIENFLNHPKSSITVVDPFLLGDATCSLDENTYNRFLYNVQQSSYPEKISVIKEPSQEALYKLKNDGRVYDYISIDGSHLSADVLSDAVLSFHLLKKGGYIFFDDYEQTYPSINNPGPKIAIDAFLNCFKDNINLIHKGYHVIIKRV